jgi:hypothetical protein
MCMAGKMSAINIMHKIELEKGWGNEQAAAPNSVVRFGSFEFHAMHAAIAYLFLICE